jgi:hypothetical protein
VRATDAVWAQGGEHDAPKRESRKAAAVAPRPYGAAIATAAVATLMGLGVTFGVIAMLDKKAPADAPPRPAPSTAMSLSRPSAEATTTIASGVASSPPPAAPSTEPAPSANANNDSPPATASGKLVPAAPNSRPRSSGTLAPLPKPTPTKLDIQRDLP